MSLRDVFLKTREMGMDRLAVISERDGNPNGMDIYIDGELFTSIKLTVDFSLPKGRIKKDQICLRCEVDELEDFIPKIFEIPLEDSVESDCNRLWIRTSKQKSTPVMEFFDAKAQPTGPRIYIYEWELAGDEDEGS
jgi:U3 small nucleolar ribonucleoprotein protein IMP4